MGRWGAWNPDKAGPDTEYVLVANGCIPQDSGAGIGYGPFPRLITASGATALSGGAPRGGLSIQKQDGTWKVYFATATTIEELQANYSWASIETGRTVTVDDDVSFAYFGKYLLNTDTTDGFKAYDVEAGGTNSVVSAAPMARALFTCSNVVFALDCNGNNRRMQSSAVGSHTNWTTLGADGKTFEDGGALIGGRDLKNGAAFIAQEKVLRLVQFGGGAALYSIVKIADGRGCVADRTMVSFDGMVFWWDTDGPWMFTLGTGPQPIGAEKINRWADSNIGASNYKTLQGTIDPSRNIVLWRTGSTQALGFNWVIKEWFTLTLNCSGLTRIATPGVTIDSVSDTIDSVAIAIDSRYWQGGAPVLGGLDNSYKFATFSGGPMQVTLQDTPKVSPVSGLIRFATPESDAPNSTLEIGTADNLNSPLTWTPAESKSGDGRVPLLARGKVISFRETIPATETWTYANGVRDIVGTTGGPQ